MPNRRNVYFFYKPEEKYEQKVQSIFQLAKQYDFTIVNDYRKANIIVAIGGDGTFLQAVHKTGFKDDCLYAGIATGETLGFYCDFHIDDTEKIVEAITSEQIEMMISSARSLLSIQGEKGLTIHEKRLIVDKLIDQIHIEFNDKDEITIKTTGVLDELLHDIESCSQREKV